MKQITQIEYSKNQKKLLRLEKKYMCSLLKCFKSAKFSKLTNELVYNIQNLIKESVEFDWNKANPIDVTFERLIHYTIYSYFKDTIVKPYPSSISSDISVVLDDAVLNIDSKTISLVSNGVDFKQLQIGQHQFSFNNKTVKNWEYRTQLADYFENKPIINFILTLRYTQDKKGDAKGFRLLKTGDGEKNMSLSCVPHQSLSELFENDIIKNFKNFTELSKIAKSKLGIERYYLGSLKKDWSGNKENGPQSTNINVVKRILMDKVPKIYENIELFKTFRDEWLALDKAKNVRYKIKLEGTSNNKDKLSLVPCEANTARIEWGTLADRYDMDKLKWSGHTEWDLNNIQK